MNYRFFIMGIVLMFGLNGCVGVSPNPEGKGYDVKIPMSTINAHVEKNFPQKKKTKYGTLYINKPNILAAKESDKLSLGTSFTFSNMFVPSGVKGAALLSSGIGYNPKNKGLYLVNPMIDELKIQKFALSRYVTPKMRKTLGKVIAKTLAKDPVYYMNDISSLVKNVSVKNGTVVLTVSP